MKNLNGVVLRMIQEALELSSKKRNYSVGMALYTVLHNRDNLLACEVQSTDRDPMIPENVTAFIQHLCMLEIDGKL